MKKYISRNGISFIGKKAEWKKELKKFLERYPKTIKLARAIQIEKAGLR